LFNEAFKQDPLTALRLAFYTRNPRGAGLKERLVGRALFRAIATNYPDVLVHNLHLIPEFGRWDDLFDLRGTLAFNEAMLLYKFALQEGDRDDKANASKWAPREKSAKSEDARILRSVLGLTQKGYRQLLARQTHVVETLMCQNRWSEIVYGELASQSLLKYNAAFYRHDGERFQAWIDSVRRDVPLAMSAPVTRGTIHVETLQPYQIIKRVEDQGGSSDALEAMWENLPNYLKENSSAIVVADVSGSMNHWSDSGQLPNGLTPMHFSVSLAIYAAERLRGPFQGKFITFSGKPTLQTVRGADLKEKLDNLVRADWAMNTNLRATFDLLLNTAREHNVPEEDMPDSIVIISDMQFDGGQYSYRRSGICLTNASLNDADWIRTQYQAAGYNVPKVIWWRINASYGLNFPIKMDHIGMATVSGASASAFKTIFSAELTPEAVVDDAVNSGDYDRVTLPPHFTL